MKHLLKSIAIGAVTSAVLLFAVVMLNTVISSPSISPSLAMTQLFILLELAPYGISGYVGGRLAQRHGLFVGLLSNIIGLSMFALVFLRPMFDRDPSIFILGILIAWLAGGVGELHAVRIKNA